MMLSPFFLPGLDVLTPMFLYVHMLVFNIMIFSFMAAYLGGDSVVDVWTHVEEKAGFTL